MKIFLDGVSIATTSSLNINLGGLASGTSYAVTVRAVDTAGNLSAASAALGVTTYGTADVTPPSVPAGLAASSITTSSFTLSWTASTDDTAVSFYEIFLNGTAVGTSTTPSTTIGNLNPLITYSVAVRAFDSAGNASALSSPLSVTTSAPSGNQITLYSSDDAFVQAGSNANTNYGSADNLAVKNQGPTDAQTRASFLKFPLPSTTTGYIQTAVLKLTVKSSKDNQIHHLRAVNSDAWTENTITWNTRPATGATLDSISGSASAESVVAFDVSAQAIAEQSGDGLLSLSIDANNNDFSSYYSKEAANPASHPVLEITLSSVAPPTAPSNLSASNVTSTSFSLSWAAPSSSVGVAGYEIFLDGGSAGTTTGTSATISALAANTTYAVTVVAVDTNGTPSAASTSLSVTTAGSSGGSTFYLTPSHDAFVQAGGYGNNNYGSADNLAVKYQGPTDEQTRESYLRFDLSSLGTGTVVSAALRLTVKNSKDNQTHTLRYVSDDSWTENALTWNNRPIASTVLDSVPGSTAAGSVVSFDVTSQVAAELNGDGSLSFAIAANNSDFSNYYSKEASDPALIPSLEVVFATSPTP